MIYMGHTEIWNRRTVTSVTTIIRSDSNLDTDSSSNLKEEEVPKRTYNKNLKRI